jgi:Mg-chelatase subunit ChlD
VLDETPVAAGRRPRPRPGLTGATVLLCGTGTHRRRRSGLPRIGAVKTTLTDLRDVLADRCGATPRMAVDPRSPDEFGDAVSDAAHGARDVLLIYYVGHGLVASNNRLYLATTRTDARYNRVRHTALPYDTVRDYVIDSPAAVKIVILDCCYSGRAVGTLSPDADIENRAAIDGAYVLTSAARDESAIAPPKARHTAFSGQLIHLLTNGDPDGDEVITMESVYRYLDRVLPAHNYPRPRRRVIGNADRFPLTDNPAFGGRPVSRPAMRPPRRRIRVPFVVAAALTATAAVPFVASARNGGGWMSLPPGVRGELLRSWWGLALLATAAAVVALLTAGPMAHWITGVAVRSRWRPMRRFPVPVLTLIAFLLATLLGGTTLDIAAAARVGVGTCPTTAHVAVLAPPDSLEPVHEMAQAFERHTAVDNFGCPDARLLVYSAPVADITTALARGWGDAEHVGIGPRPDVWLPDWSGETRQARSAAGAAGRTLPIAEERTVATTPMVLAIATRSAPAATEAGLIDGAAWPDQLDSMRRAGWDTVAADPATSVGALARIPLYNRPGEQERAVERHIEQSLDRGRHALGPDAAALLCAPDGLRARTGYLVTEQAVARFNHGDPLGPPCPRRAGDRLQAVYAGNTPVLDRQAVRFAWPGGNDRRTRAATRFTAWLAGADGRPALTAAGLRAPGPAAAPLAPEWGVQPDLQPRPAPISVDLVRQVRDSYRVAQRPGRVLIAVDASGSMGRPAPGGSLWQVATAGVQRATRLAGARDELGVWAFQGAGVRRVVPLGPPQPAAAAQALSRVRPQGPAPLYRAIVTGLSEVGPTTADRATAVVLLTDGEDDNASALDARQFRAAVTGKGVRVFAVAMGAAGCAAPVLRTVTTATAGTCLEAGDGTVDEQLATIFEAVL